MAIRLVLAACFTFHLAAALAADDDANSPPAGKLQAIAKEASDLLRLKVAGKGLCLDREHWAAAAKPEKAKDANDADAPAVPRRGFRKGLRIMAGGGMVIGGMGGEGGDPAQILFTRLQTAAGCNGLSMSSDGTGTQMCSGGSGMLLAMSTSGESFSLSIMEETDAGQIVRLSEPRKGELHITVLQPARLVMLTLKQAPDGRITIAHIRGEKATRLQADSYVDLFRKQDAYVTRDLLPLLRQVGVILGEHRFSPAVLKAVLSLLASPLNAEREKQFDAQIADLEANTFAKREAATKALQEDLVYCYPQVAAAAKTATAGSEKRERLEKVLATDPDLRKVCEIVHEGRMLQDAAYLVALLDRVDAKDRPAVAAGLHKLTGKDFGADPAAWKKWLDEQPKN